MPVYRRDVIIDAPVSTVFAFHERDDALALLSPPVPPVRIVSRTGGIRAGARVELRVAWCIRWVAVHTAYERDRLFVDEQASGPFRVWRHRHEFESMGARTRLTDIVTFEVPGGRLVNALAGLAAAPGLGMMFRYRHRVTRRLCERAA
ncbi:MAG: SRPBCC family protein [Vicinamibacterales bacterium]